MIWYRVIIKDKRNGGVIVDLGTYDKSLYNRLIEQYSKISWLLVIPTEQIR